MHAQSSVVGSVVGYHSSVPPKYGSGIIKQATGDNSNSLIATVAVQG